MMIRTGARTPWFSGTSVPRRQRSTYITADAVTAGGAFVLAKTSGPVPVKSKTAVPAARSIVSARAIGELQEGGVRLQEGGK